MGKISVVFILLIMIVLCFRCTYEQSGGEKAGLETLDSLKRKCLERFESADYLESVKLYEKEATKQNNNLHIGDANMLFFDYYSINKGITYLDSLNYYSERSKEYYTKAGDRARAIQAELAIIRKEIIYKKRKEGTFTRMFDLIKEGETLNSQNLVLKIYNLLGQAYFMSNNPKEAFKAYQNRLEYLKSTDLKQLKEPTKQQAFFNSFLNLTYGAQLLNEKELALSYSDSLSSYVQKYRKYFDEYNENIADVYRISTLSALDRTDEAAPIVEKFLVYYDSIKSNNISVKRPIDADVLQALSNYYVSTKEYDKALAYINEVIRLSKININSDDYRSVWIENKKSDILAAQGEYKEAFLLKDKVLEYEKKESIINNSWQIGELRTIHKVDKLEQQSIKDKAKASYSLLVSVFLIVLCVLLIIIILIVRRNFSLLKNKNEKIFAQYRELDKQREEIKGLTLLAKKERDAVSQETSLFEKVEEYMLKTHCYRDPNISREFVATQIGTNRQYLAQAIQENVNMTFTEYINNHRLEYARFLLSEDTGLSIEDIYLSSGFINKSTFYRLFKLKYDLTPKEFRDVALIKK